ncbi:12351_t:CDS:2 [Entrophospora sp. SA101]|nr:12351_t:CDS:2 [Entrophospora sp. SA101]
MSAIIQRIFLQEDEDEDESIFLTILENPGLAIRDSARLNVINTCLKNQGLDSMMSTLCCDVIQTLFETFELSDLANYFGFAAKAITNLGTEALQKITAIAFLKVFVEGFWNECIQRHNYQQPIVFDLMETDGAVLIKEINDFMSIPNPLIHSLKIYFLRILRNRHNLPLNDVKQFCNRQNRTLPWLASIAWEDNSQNRLSFNPYWALDMYAEADKGFSSLYSLKNKAPIKIFLQSVQKNESMGHRIAFGGVVVQRIHLVHASNEWSLDYDNATITCRNHAIAPDVLIATDVYPQKLLKTRRLLNTLTSNLDDYNLQATASSSSNNIPFSLRDRRKSMDSLSLTSSVTSLHLKHITSDTEDEFQHIPNSYKSLHSLFVDDDNVTQYGSTSSVPSIKISGQNNNHSDICKQHRNYRSELVHTILTLLCKYYHLCRSITLQVLLELLYYNGSGECLTPDQIELMNKTERDLQEKLKKYFSESSEFPLEQIEKALEESMFGGDKKPVVKEDNSEDIVKCVKTLNLIRQSRLLLSRQTISEEFNFENDELNEDQELVYHNIADEEKIALAKEMSLAQNQEQHHKPPKNLNDLITEYDKSRKNIAADLNNNNDDDSTISSNVEELEISVDKRKLTVLEKLGIELNE